MMVRKPEKARKSIWIYTFSLFPFISSRHSDIRGNIAWKLVRVRNWKRGGSTQRENFGEFFYVFFFFFAFLNQNLPFFFFS